MSVVRPDSPQNGRTSKQPPLRTVRKRKQTPEMPPQDSPRGSQHVALGLTFTKVEDNGSSRSFLA